MIETRNYPALAAYPATGPATGPARMTVEGRVVRVLLSGTGMTARVQISNVQNAGGLTDAQFVPPESAWTTVATLTGAGGVHDVLAPARWTRVVLDSGTATGGTIEEDTRAQGGARAEGGLGNVSAAALADRPGTAGAQLADGSRWLWQASGTPDGGTVVAASGGGVWVRERVPRTWNAQWYAAQVAADGGDWGAALTALVNRMADGDTLDLPPRDYATQTPWVISRPITVRSTPGAKIVAYGAGIAVDVYPSGTRTAGGTRYHAGGYGEAEHYDLDLPVVFRGYGARRGQGAGVRITNSFHGRFLIPEIDGFALGLDLYADRTLTANLELGTSYNHIEVGVLRNYVNLRVAPDLTLAVNSPLHAYVTANEIHVRSFTSPGDLPTDKSGHTHVVFDSPSWPRNYHNNLHAPLFEGHARVAVDARGTTFRNYIHNAVFEMPFCDFIFKLSNETDSYHITDGSGIIPFIWENPAKFNDTGKRNRISGGGYGLGQSVEYAGGVWAVRRKESTDYAGNPVLAPVDWRPERLSDEPVLEVFSDGTPFTVDLRRWRRVRVFNNAGVNDLYANLIVLTNIPDPAVVETEFELQVYMDNGFNYLNGYVIPGVLYGPHPELVAKKNAMTGYRLRRVNWGAGPQWIVTERFGS